MKELINFTLNDNPVRMTIDGERTLLWVLRTDLKITGVKYGCGRGFCGACTTLIENRAVRSCQVPVKNVKGKAVLTIEGLEKNGKLHPLQNAFIEHDALQCGFCTPGMILNAFSLLHENPEPSRVDIVREMDGNLCRCGSHTRIVRAILSAAQELRRGSV